MTIRKNLVYSYLDRYASLLISIISSMVIARLLTPKDIGVFSVTMILLSFLASVRDMGAGGYLVQEKELTRERVRSVWAVQLGIGILLALIILAVAKPVALFYEEPRMFAILLLMAASYAINPFGSLTYAWQIREMQFGALSITRFTSALVGAMVSVYMAWIGKGPISLAFGGLASTVTGAVIAFYFRPRWFPWLPGLKELRRVLTFGTQSTGATIMQTIHGSASELLLGKLQGMTATGLFSRATGLVAMFDRLVMSGISSVATSWFAKQAREHGSISEPFLKATAYVTAIGWSFAVSLIFLAHPAIRILYGTQWDGSVDLTRLLAGALVCSMPAAMCVTALMAVGAVTHVLRGTAVVMVVGVMFAAIGASLGLLALGACLVASSAASSIYWLRTTQKVVHFDWIDLLQTLRKSAGVGLAAGTAPIATFALYGPYPASIWQPMLFSVTGGILGFILAVLYLKHPLATELIAIKEKFKAKQIFR